MEAMVTNATSLAALVARFKMCRHPILGCIFGTCSQIDVP